MKTSSLRQVIVALTIAVSAATIHGAWFASTDAHAAAPVITISTWDYYEKSWTSATHDLANYTVEIPLTVRHSEDTIVAISGAAVTLPIGLNADELEPADLATLQIPEVSGAVQYLHLLVSKPANLAGSWPVIGSGPVDPDDTHLAALDVDGSVGVHTVSVDGGGTFTWDIGRWSKGDIFLGLNNHTYKVLDRNGNFKRFVASADYDQNYPDEIYNVTTGCATNWKTGEVFATNFGDYRPAVNILGRHPAADYPGDLSLYSSPSRRISTRIDRTDDALTEYANPYTSINYGVDTSPESVVFDADMNMYVGHSFGNFRQAPADWQGDPDKIFEFDDEWTEYTIAVDGLPLEGWSWDDGWGWVVDETGVRMLLAPLGTTDPDAFTGKTYGVEVSPRLSYNPDGTLRTATANQFYPAVAGLDGWNPNGQLPESFLSDPRTGTALVRPDQGGALVPSRWSLGKRLHKYLVQDGAYQSTPAARDEFWTFSGRQGTDWIDLDVTGEVMYYTSEDSFIHRYRVKPGSGGEPVGQLPDVGVALEVNGQPTLGKLAIASNPAEGMTGGVLGDYRFHGLRILPPGDGTGGFLVAVENGLGVHRFTEDGKWVQRYYAHVDRDRNPLTGTDGREHLVSAWYTLEVDPGGRSFWASAHDSGWVVQFDIASGRILNLIEAVEFVPQGTPGMTAGRRVEGICIMWEYTAPQEICFTPDGDPQGVDDDGDGYVDENCVAIEVCSAVSPGDDDGDNLPDQYDSDCSPELPPVAIDDAYAMKQQDPAQPTLSVDASSGVIRLGPLADYDRDSGTYADVNALTVASFGANESSLTLAPGDTLNTPDVGSVVLQADGSFVFTPDPDFHGVFSFAYRITDGYPANGDPRDVPADGSDDLATVRITVAPKVANDGTYSLWVGEVLSMGGLLTNDPAQSSALYPITVTEAGASGNPVAFSGSRTFQTGHLNTVTVNADGSFSFSASNLAYGGADYFTYAVHNTVSRSWNVATVTFDVRRPVITVVVPDQVKTYDGTPLPTTCTVTSERVADPAYTLTYAGTIRGGGAYGPTTTAPTAAGNYTATCVHTDPALGPQSDTGSIVINPVPLVVTAADTTRPYLSANPPVTRTITGFVNGETESVIGGTTTCTTSTPQSANVGTYADVNTCSQTLSATNYAFSYVPGDLTITGFVLTVTASNTEKTYGEPNPAVTYSITGFQGGDTAATVVNGTTTCSTTGGTSAGTFAGANTCTPTLTATNYTFVYVPGNLVVNKVPLVVTAADTTRPYLAANPTVTRTITGFVNGDTESVLTGTTTCSTSTPQSANVGTYADANTCSETLSSPNYDISYVPGDLTVTALVLTVTASNIEKFYGDPNPAVTYDITGFQGGDTAATAVTGTTVCSTTGGTNAGTYADANTCTPTLTATNYTFVYVPGDLVIKKVPLVVTAADTTRPYLSANPAVTRTITGFVNGETEAVLTGTTTCSTSTPQSANVGTYADVNSCSETLSSTNYDISYVPGDLTVTGFVLTVKAADTEKFYGAANPPVAYTITGFQGGEDASVVSGTTTCTTDASQNVGTYTGANTCSPTLTATNYTFVYEPGTLIVKKVPLVVTAADTTRPYLAANPAVTRTITGFVNGDTESVLTGTTTCSTSTPQSANVGTYADANTCSETLSSPNYDISYVPGDLTVTGLVLTVTASNIEKFYGDPNPAVTYDITGFQGGDTAATVVTGTTTCSAAGGASAGTYAGANTCTPTLTATNYTFVYVPGDLVIKKVPLVVTAADTTRPYLSANPTVTRTITGFVNGETEAVLTGTTTCSTSTPQSANVGTYADANTCSETLSSPNYDISYVPGDLTITGLVLTVTAADTEKFYGDPNPAVTYDITGFQGGDTAATAVTGTTTCSTAGGTNAGTYADANSCTPTLTATNYSFVYVPGDLVIKKVPLVVTAADTTRPYLAANPTVTRTITGFVNGDTESVLTGTTTCSTSTPQSANVGTYADVNTCSETLSSPNYDISYVPGDLTVTGFVLTVTASSVEKFYGDPNPTVTYDITGFQGDDTAATVVNGTTACSTTGGTSAGTYAGANTCTPTLTATNYTFVYVPGDLIIKKVPLVVTAATTTKVYGDPNPAVSRTISGFVNGDDAGDLGGTSVCSTSASAGPNVGSYNDANVCTENLTSPNYTFTYVPGDFSITPRPLTVQANDKTMVLGSPLPALDGTLTGTVVTGDVINVAYASTNPGTVVGQFPNVIVPSVTAGGSTLLTNYNITLIPGTLTVVAAPCSGNDGYTTYSQGGWGSKPSGGNPGALLATHFGAVYPNGVVIGGTYTLTFTSASAIEAFLPAGGTSKPLTASAVNPTSSAAGNIGAQLLALRLATDFSAAGVTKRGLGSLVMMSGPLAGQTVNQILDLANAVVGGQSSALPSGLSISELSSILESLNLNYHEGTENEGLLSCGGTPPCSPTELSFTGSSSVSGTAGNIRTFSAGGVSVKASAFSRVKGTNGAWAPAYLGVWSEGLGVTDTSESGSNNTHKTDNNGRLNYVLFEFSEPVIVSRAYLDSISGDSDATIWVGTRVSPYTNHITLSDAVLASLGAGDSSSGGGSARWAEFNGDAVVGNVLVIAANVSGSNDSFKVSKLQLECGAVAPEPDPVAPTIAATGGTYVYSGDARPGTCSVTGANDVALPGTLSYNPGPSAPSQVGTYTVTCSFAGDASYTPATATATLTITPAPLTVEANDKTKAQGTQNPELDGTLTGVVGGDAITAGYTTTATTTSPVGTYPIVPILSDPAGRLSNYTVTTVNGVLTVTPPVAVCSTDGYLTYSQGGWGSSPSGNNPGAFLAANFDRVYGDDGVVIGGNRTLTFTSASAIARFLPQGGQSNVLSSSAINPRRSSAGNFAAQLLALRLAVDFSAAGVTKRGLGSLVMQSGPLAGMTVDAILAMSNTVIGGTTSALPQGMSMSTLSSILESLNMNYHEGTDNRGLLGCGGGLQPIH